MSSTDQVPGRAVARDETKGKGPVSVRTNDACCMLLTLLTHGRAEQLHNARRQAGRQAPPTWPAARGGDGGR